jgi:hypothetical protein
MMNVKFLVIPLIATALITGCANNKASRQAAIAVRSSINIHESTLDAKIAEQNKYHQKQIALIRKAEESRELEGADTSKRLQALRQAEKMALDPDNEARIGPLLDYIVSAVEQEYAELQQLREKRMKAGAEYSAALQQFNREKKALAEVKKSLDTLATKKTHKEQAEAIQKFAEELKKQLEAKPENQ